MLRIAVVGATGAVGHECLKLLDSTTAVAVEQVVPVATQSSAGRDLASELALSVPMTRVTTLDRVDFTGIDVALFCAGAETSLREGEKVAAAGALVVDNSSAFRRRTDVPLVVPQVNAHLLQRRPATGLIANPNCSAIQLVRALHPLERLAGLDQVVLSTYQSASGGGFRGLREFASASARRLETAGVEPEAPGRYGQPLAFNLVPEIGLSDDTGFSHEERKLVYESRRILGLPSLRITATAVRVPVFDCHSEAVYVRTREPVAAHLVEKALAATPGLQVYRRGDAAEYPMPRLVAACPSARTLVHVGRIRTDPEDDCALWLWVVADNLWVGAALNAVEIVEVAVGQGWLR
jgi:aspartate-semialdehyde dehydrogenase